MITRPFTTRGAPVIVYGLLVSVVCTCQSTWPFFASSAIRRPSSAPTNTRPSETATPRFTTSQQASRPLAFGTCGSYIQSRRPLAASSACTTLQLEVA